MGGLSIQPITAYNLIVDSNVESLSTYGPSAATLGAKFCNTTGAAMSNVWAYIGSFDPSANTGTPGIYPVRTPASITENTTLSGATATDYGADDNGAVPSRLFSLKHQSGTASKGADASRYIGSLAAGECRVQYWLVSYPRIALVGGSWKSVTGGIKPDDDLWLSYYFWASSNTTGGTPSYIWRPVTMRNEISAMANKIWPNGSNKVPTEYRNLVTSTVGWDTRTPNGTGMVYPGQVATSEGIWYDFGNVGAGFDNNYDLAPDRNAWVQPIGDAGLYDPGCFRLVHTHGVVIIKLNDGTNKVIQFEDQLYFENVPDNNNGAVGLVYYDYVALDGACTAGLSPYQEVASGYDNEKFNGDFGSGTPPLQSTQTNLVLDKNGDPSVGPGGTVNYSLTFTLPQAGPGATMYITVGNPALGLPLVYEDTVPDKMTYVANSASTVVSGPNLPSNPMAATLMFSTDSGATWSTADPGSKLSSAPNNLVKIQWWLSQSVTQKSNADVTGTVSFRATAPGANPPPSVTNTGCLKMGGGPCFTQDSFTTLITGPYSLSGTVFCDDGAKYSSSGPCTNTTNAGTYANGTREVTPAEPGMPAVTVELYYDANGNGVIDSGEIRVGAQDSTASGGYAFNNLPAGSFIVKVIKNDGDIQATYGLTTPETRKAVITTTNISGLDFGFAPPLTVSKALTTLGTINIGELFNYTLTVRNNLPGGSGTANSCTYTIWSSKYVLDSNGIPKGGNGTNAQFQNAGAVTGLPDYNNAYTNLANADNLIGIKGFNVDPSTLPGTITGVQALLKVSERSNLASDATLQINPYYNGNGTGTTPASTYANNATGTLFSAGSIFPGPTGASYDFTYDLFGLKSWTPADFTLDNTAIQVKVGKGGGANSGTLNLDAAALLVTTNQPCPSTADTTLNPAPLTDAFPTAYMDYVSADPPATMVNEAAGTLAWDNIGPIPAGSYRQVTVTFRASAAAANQVNTAASTGGKFATGLNANSDSATAQVTISNVVANGQISGEVFSDKNQNGWVFGAACTAGSGAICPLEAADAAIQGVRVNLYACTKTDGSLETASGNKDCATQTAGNEWLVWQTTYTNSSGYYAFTNLRQGFYRAVIDASTLPGAVQKADPNAAGICSGAACDNQSNGDVNTNAISLGTINGNTISNVNFGYYVSPTLYNFGDEVFFDWNGNGVRDSGDEIIPGVTLKLLDAGDAQLATTTTDAAQTHPYSFSKLNGIYTVKVDTSTLPAIPLTQTADPDQSGVTCTSCDGEKTFTLNGADVWTLDFGYQPQGLGSIGDTVFRDVNGDGAQSGVQELGIPNISVSLLADMNNDGTWVTVKTTATDAKGNYLFTGLPDGTYRVSVNTADSDLPKDAFGAGYRATTLTTYQVRLSGGIGAQIGPVGSAAACVTNCALDADYGFAPLATLGDTIYLDINGNGTQDFGEPGVAGVKVNLYTFSDTVTKNNKYTPGEPLGGLVASTTTDTSGRYLFTALPPNLYVAMVDTTTGGLTGKLLTGDPDADGVACNTLPEPYTGFYAQCDSRNGMRLYYGSNYMGADFGYQPRGVIGDTLWLDADADGVQDPGETGIPYAGINLTGPGCSPCTVQTDVNGSYLFGDLADGTYTLTVNTADPDFPIGLASTYDPDALHDGSTSVVISGGSVTGLGGAACTNCALKADFGYRYSGAGRLSGTLCSDSVETEWDGLCGSGVSGVGNGEAPFASLVVDLFRWNDLDNDGLVTPNELTRAGSTTASTNGDYVFTNLPDSAYYVVSLSAPLTDLKLTTVKGSSPAVGNDAKEQVVDLTASGSGVYQVVHLGTSENAQNVDFAFNTKLNEDFGDLPASYSTTLQGVPDAARHVISPNLYLGTAPDADENGLVSANATGDNLNNQNDEDGVTINVLEADWSDVTGMYAPNGTGKLRIDIAGSGYLVGWIDFNKDGDFKDAGETVINQAVTTGSNQPFTFPVPSGVFNSAKTVLNARFRLFPSAPIYPQFAYSGQATAGEVEDYQFTWSMQVDLDADPHAVAPNGQTTYQLTLNNNGSQPLTGIQANIALPSGFSLVSFSGPGGVTCTGPNAVNCAGLSLNPGQMTTITLTVQVSGTPGTYQTDASATANEFDTGVSITDSGVANDSDTLANLGVVESDPATDEDVVIQSMATLGDWVWNDLDKDGIQDPGEPGLDGVTVRLLDAGTQAVLQTTTTAGGGLYSFTAPAGAYMVEFVTPSGYTAVPTGQGTTATDSDADSTTGRSAFFSVTGGQVDNTWDAGFILNPPQTAIIGDFVWNDLNHDGIQDAGETGLDGVTVRLLDASTLTVQQTTTTVGGAYSFTAPAGSYVVEFVKPAGYAFAQTGAGTAATDSNANTTNGRTATITVTAGQTDTTWDAGLYQTATIGDFVWNDINVNGVQDGAETGIDGVTVRLLDAATLTLLQTTTTAGGGAYGFSVPSGSYVIEFGKPTGYAFTKTGQGTASTDSDANITNGRTTTITVTPGQNDSTWDAGFYQPATLGDRVWNDLDHNGVQDAGEPGLDGVTVRLLDSTGTSLLQTTMTVGGAYSFTAPSGSYIIEFIAPSGYAFTPTGQGTASTGSDANITTGQTTTMTVTPGQTDTTWDAGLYQPATLGDLVWNDLNHNGVQDPGEPGLDGVTVNLMDATGSAVLQTTVTAGGGLYNFTIPSGTYQVQFVLPVGYAYVTTGQGTAATDSNAGIPNGLTGPITLAPGQANTTWDAGLYQPAIIGDRVWNDLDHNGIQDAGELGLDGMTVRLLDAVNLTVLQTTTTTGGGLYSFTVPSGAYVVEFVKPTGYAFTQTGQGDTATNSDADGTTGRTATINITPGQTDTTWDAGLYQPATLGDFIWNDLNHDGIQDPGEPGLDGATVRLLDSAGTTVLQTTTTVDGNYNFTAPAGSYMIEFVAPSGYTFTQTGQGTASTDSDANTTGRTLTITLTPGQNDSSWDAGLYQPATLGNFVWNDLNRNGIQDDGELGLSNVTVRLLDAATKAVLQTTVTGADGSYSFTAPSGSYIVEFTAPALYQFTVTNAGANDTVDSDAAPADGRTAMITLTPGQTDLTWDAGLYQPDATLGDLVWNDLDQDGVQDAGEPGIPGVTVRLLDGSGTLISSTLTGPDGGYSFTAPAGSYILAFVTPPGYQPTQANAGGSDTTDSDASVTTGRTSTITLSPGQTDLTWDAGFYQPSADLHISKTDSVSSYTPGASLTYTIVVSNSGPNDAPGAVVSDAIPAQISAWSWTCAPAGGASGCDPVTGSSADFTDMVDLPAGGSITYTVTATIDPGATGSLTNAATITPPSSINDPTDDNIAQDTDSPAPIADLQIQKDDGTDTFIPGGTLTYTITVTNHGPSNVTGATVTDKIPAQITQWQFTCAVGSNATCDGTTGFTSTDFSDVIDLAVNESITYTVAADLDPVRGDNLSNTAWVTPPTGATDPDLTSDGSENAITDSDLPSYQADVSVRKDDGVTAYVPGASLTYTIVVSNSGPSSVMGATFTDLIPPQISQWTWDCVETGGATGCTGVTGSAADFSNTIDLPVNSSITYTVTAVTAPSASGSLTNTAGIELPIDLTDPTPGDNADTDVDAAAPSADLSITKTDGVTSYAPGVNLTYTIIVSNSGPSDVTGAVVTDSIPAQISQWTWTCVHAGGASGCDGVTNSAADFSDTADLPAGSSITYTVMVVTKPAATGALKNTAQVEPPTTINDPTPGNNSGTDTDTAAPSADLSITKTDGASFYTPGGLLTYTIVASNNGLSDVTGAVVTDTLPSALSGATWTCTPGAACAVTSGSGNINTTVNIPAGGSVTFTVQATVANGLTGSLSNTAQIEPPTGVTDPNTGDNVATDTDLNPPTPQVDLAILKTDGVTTYVPGVTLTYTITVTNNSLTDVTGATVTDSRPAEITQWAWTCNAPGSTTCDGAAMNAANFSDTVDLKAGEIITYTVTAQVDPAALTTLTNTATVTPPNGVNDPTPENNSSTDQDTAAAQADVTVLKTVDLAHFNAGSILTYTLTVTNSGPSDAQNVIVSDPLPAQVQFASATPAPVDPAATPLTWYLGTLKAGAAPTVITLKVQVNEGITDAFDNTASVTTTTPETDGNNNTGTATITPEDPTPVTLLYFTVRTQGPKAVVAQWAAAMEVDTFGYKLMRSEKNDPSTAVEVAFVPVDPATMTYQVIDPVTGHGRYYYWLVVVDTTGKGAVERSASVNLGDSYQIYMPMVGR